MMTKKSKAFSSPVPNLQECSGLYDVVVDLMYKLHASKQRRYILTIGNLFTMCRCYFTACYHALCEKCYKMR